MKAHIAQENFDECPGYNDWLDQQYESEHSGLLEINGFKPRPSLVLHQLSFDTYQAAFADYLSEREEEVKERVFSAFPRPIAHPFYRFESGYENVLQRLHFLRDTWEAIVDVVHGLTVSECRYRKIHLGDPMHFHELLSDKVSQRLQNIERIMGQAQSCDIQLAIQRLIDVSVLARMRELNQTRNAFSHGGAQSEKQAAEWITASYEDVLGVLSDLAGLASVKLYRYLGHIDAENIRCELFNGHSPTRTIRDVVIGPDNVAASAACFHKDRLFATLEDQMFTLEPLLHVNEDDSGHATDILMFRRTAGQGVARVLEFEIVGKGAPMEVERSEVRGEINELRRAFGIEPE